MSVIDPDESTSSARWDMVITSREKWVKSLHAGERHEESSERMRAWVSERHE
jgi:hypothetical protein